MSTELKDKVEDKIDKPSMWRVILLNDDFTPMDFVVFILIKVFGKTFEEAQALMMEVHKKGSTLAGVYTYEIAETKVLEVVSFAKREEHPFQCAIEKDES
jgi:ATP-dependent Clp protease adaptor protein ClpS